MELITKSFNDLTIQELYEVLRARCSVFVVEQQCAYQDIDDKDQISYHVIGKQDDEIQAYARVIEAHEGFDMVSIGRVLTLTRGSGLGKKVMAEAIRVAQEVLDADVVYIEAQTYAKGFYEQFGFEQISDEFLEDGIPHIKMTLKR